MENRLTWFHLDSLGLAWTHLDPGVMWIHVNALGFTECKNNGSVYVLDFKHEDEKSPGASLNGSSTKQWTSLVTGETLGKRQQPAPETLSGKMY